MAFETGEGGRRDKPTVFMKLKLGKHCVFIEMTKSIRKQGRSQQCYDPKEKGNRYLCLSPTMQ